MLGEYVNVSQHEKHVECEIVKGIVDGAANYMFVVGVSNAAKLLISRLLTHGVLLRGDLRDCCGICTGTTTSLLSHRMSCSWR